MNRVMRIVGALPGVMMALSGLNWLINPKAAAEALGMPLLDGIGRSSQVGDFTAFFLACSGFIFLGVVKKQRHWMYAAAALIGAAAVFRTVAAVAHDADLAVVFIAVEAVMAAILIAAAHTFPASAS